MSTHLRIEWEDHVENVAVADDITNYVITTHVLPPGALTRHLNPMAPVAYSLAVNIRDIPVGSHRDYIMGDGTQRVRVFNLGPNGYNRSVYQQVYSYGTHYPEVVETPAVNTSFGPAYTLQGRNTLSEDIRRTATRVMEEQEARNMAVNLEGTGTVNVNFRPETIQVRELRNDVGYGERIDWGNFQYSQPPGYRGLRGEDLTVASTQFTSTTSTPKYSELQDLVKNLAEVLRIQHTVQLVGTELISKITIEADIDNGPPLLICSDEDSVDISEVVDSLGE